MLIITSLDKVTFKLNCQNNSTFIGSHWHCWSLCVRALRYHDFLSGRRQRVVVNGKLSSCEEILSGIPQGSVLGPILLVIFINDLPDEVMCTAKIFADDTKLFHCINSQEDRVLLQDDLNRLVEWSRQWQMSFNAVFVSCHTICKPSWSCNKEIELNWILGHQTQVMSRLYVFDGRGRTRTFYFYLNFFCSFLAYIYLRVQLERDPESDRLGHYAQIPGWISTRTVNLQLAP